MNKLLNLLQYHKVSFQKQHYQRNYDGCTYLGSVVTGNTSWRNADLYLHSNPLDTTLMVRYGEESYKAGCNLYVPDSEYSSPETFETLSNYYITLAGNIAIAAELETHYRGVITPEIISSYGEHHSKTNAA